MATTLILHILCCGIVVLIPEDVSAEPIHPAMKSQQDFLREIEHPWFQYTRQLAAWDEDGVRKSLGAVYESMLNRGIRNLPMHAAALSIEGEKMLAEGRIEEAKVLAEISGLLAEDYPYGDFLKASIQLKMSPFRFWRAFKPELRGLRKYATTFEGKWKLVARTVTILFKSISLFYCVLVPILLIRHMRAFLHDLEHRLPRSISKIMSIPLVMLTLALPFVLQGGLLWCLIVPLFMIWAYLSRPMKILCLTLFVFLGLAPEIIGFGAGFTDDARYVRGRALYSVIEGDWKGEGEAVIERLAGEDPDNSSLQFALAVLKKRRREYDAASRLYKGILDVEPDHPGVLVNMGNIHFIRGDLDKAENLYLKAIGLDRQLAASHYNLSKLHQSKFLMNQGEREFNRAWRLDPELINYYVRIDHPEYGNRALIDVVPETYPIWDRSRHYEKEGEISDSVWHYLVHGIPLSGARVLTVGLLLLLAAIELYGSRLIRVKLCPSCGDLICKRCLRSPVTITDLCAQCYQVYYHRDGIDPEKRKVKLRAIREHQLGQRTLTILTSIVLPGSGHVLRGYGLKGGMFAFLFCLWMVVLVDRVSPLPPGVSGTLLVSELAKALFLIAGATGYGLCLRDIVNRTRPGMN